MQKAKEVRPFVEKLITLAKKGTLHARRLAISRMGPLANAEVKPRREARTTATRRTIIQKLFNDIGPRFKDRPGGYTRVIKRHERRLGDGGQTAFLELLKEGETRQRIARPAPAPVPRVEDESPETPPEHQPHTPPAEAHTGATPPTGTAPESPPA